MTRPTEITIDVLALLHNVDVAKSHAPNSHLVAVIKADAYGHGAVEIAKTLVAHVDMFAVSSLDEALELRENGIKQRVLLLEGCFDEKEVESAAQQGFDVVTHNQQQVEMLSLSRAKCTQGLNVWLKIDTGMHRLGISPSSTVETYQTLLKNETVNKVVLMTHLSVADEIDDEAKRRFTQQQLMDFDNAIQPIIQSSNQGVDVSIANSAGLTAWPDARANWNRPGIMLYGLSPFSDANTKMSLKPVMTFCSQVIAIRQIDKGQTVGYGNTWVSQQRSVIATVAVGYGDGYPRNARSGTPVLVNGKFAKLCGRVSMDMITVDVTELTNVHVGDKVELWGANLNANTVASWADTIGYELVTRMPKRTKRRLINVALS